MPIDKSKVGQIIQIARGNLLTRLANKPLARGELFIHIADKTEVTTQTVHDLVTNSNIKTIFKGDLFAGANNSKDVYSIGSGGALKWGGVLFSGTTYAAAVEKAKAFPNYIFMYNGDEELYEKATDGTTISVADTTETQPGKVDKSYVAKSSEEYQNRINPGDLFFYNPALDQTIVLHLSRSTDALTKINVDDLVSSSMTKLLEELPIKIEDSQNYESSPSTLKTFLDGPARHYQYLVDTYGWTPVTITTPSVVNRDSSPVTVTSGQVSIPDDAMDGTIWYIPFSKTETGANTYKFDPSDSRVPAELLDITLREGDLIMALPDKNTTPNEIGKEKAGVKFAVVSLYGAILDKFRLKFTKRADQYATDIWENGIEGSYTGDTDYFKAKDSIQDFINRLFETKVDIDPITGKIISSQLPDFLLGAPKYMGHTEFSDWGNLTSDTTAQEFAKMLLQEGNWENLDNSEDDTGKTETTPPTEENPSEIPTPSSNENNVVGSPDVNEKLKSGCYWIYTGETQNIEELTGIFHFCGNKDDFQDGTGDNENVDSNAEHLLNKGDWIIYNGELEKFEVIDNTSSFIGILVEGVKVAGVAKFDSPKETLDSKGAWTATDFKAADPKEYEDLKLSATADTVHFENKNKIFSPDLGLLDPEYLVRVAPGVSGDGNRLLVNTRFKFVSNASTGSQSGLSVSYPEGLQDTSSGVLDTSFLWHRATADLIARKGNNAGYTTKDIEANTWDLFAEDENSVLQGNGLNFGWFHFMEPLGEIEERDLGTYVFNISYDTNPNLYLPNYSGTLTTEEYVNTGFTVVKEIINDMYDAVIKKMTSGHVNWLQTLRDTDIINPETGEPFKELFDSKVLQDFDETYLKLKLFFHTPLGKDKYAEEIKQGNSLSTYQDLKSTDAPTNVIDNSALDVELGEDGEVGHTILNPSVAEDVTTLENILPNHSGIILNNNSVIDCGEWL